jgi:hypothetical protein
MILIPRLLKSLIKITPNTFSLRNEPSMTLHAFIKKNLGHESSGATQNYNTLNITTDRMLDKDTTTVINATHIATVKLSDEVEGLKDFATHTGQPSFIHRIRPPTSCY